MNCLFGYILYIFAVVTNCEVLYLIIIMGRRPERKQRSLDRLKTIDDRLSDIMLIERIRLGEKKLFEYIMRRYNPRLFRIGRSIIKDEDEVEDVLQETYLKVYENLQKFENRSSFSTWLIRILMNTALARKTQMNKLEYADEQSNGEDEHFSYNKLEQPDMKTPESNSINNELKNYLEDAVDKLPQIYRTVFMMREVEEMSIAETSECLQISETNVKVRLNRAKEMLRENLSGIYKESELFQFLGARCDRLVESVMKKLNILATQKNYSDF